MSSRINKDLLVNVTLNPTTNTTQRTIEELCRDIDKRKIVLPYYQTGIRWTNQKIIDLLNFELNGYAPLAPISVNNITTKDSKVLQVTFIDRDVVLEDEENWGRISVNDGQQRLSANYFAYINHPRVENMVLDLFKGEFRELPNIFQIKKHQIPIGILLNKDIDVFDKYKDENSFLKTKEAFNILMKVRYKMFSYWLTVNQATDLTQEQQLDWFWKLNNAGSVISALQMKFSEQYVEGIDIHIDYLDKFITILNDTNMNRCIQKETETSIPIATLNPAIEVILGKKSGSHRSTIATDRNENVLAKLNSEQLEKCFEITLRALEQAIKFIKDNDLSDPQRMEYITFLAALYIYLENEELNELQKDKYIEWYKKTQIVNMQNTEKRNEYEEVLKIRYIGIETKTETA